MKGVKMRYLAFSLVVISLLFFSCQDNTVTDPVSPNQINKTGNFGERTIKGSIPLDKIIYVSDTTKSYYQINGKINYSEEIFGNIPSQTEARGDIKLGITVDALLTDPRVVGPGTGGWKISSESEDVLYVRLGGINVFERSYPVMNRKDDMQLVCTFIITTNGLSLENMVLKIPNNLKTS
jgi:hypothetical protein